MQVELAREEAALQKIQEEGGSRQLSVAEGESTKPHLTFYYSRGDFSPSCLLLLAGDKVKVEYKRLYKLYRSRRSKTLEIVDMVCERANKPRKVLLYTATYCYRSPPIS